MSGEVDPLGMSWKGSCCLLEGRASVLAPGSW